MAVTQEFLSEQKPESGDAGSDIFSRLDHVVNQGWAEVHAGRLWKHIREHGIDQDLYQALMVELFHYTRHNSINQAFAAWKVSPENIGLLKFCYEHADDELGHEKMVEHDLRVVGLLTPDLLARAPLPPTQALIAYLYYIGFTKGAIARLGYSYWAETAYDHIAEVLTAIRQHLGFTDPQLTFFVSHQKVDVHHAKQVHDAIERYAVSPEDQASVIEVARTTLYLTGKLLEAAFDAYTAGRSKE
ncbi:iron-containing redox enzyme family protein [Trinickia fusca]|uniref:Iron-containing redox enzyme family protein n=1 Tax=Trinickia fusca TaxID=2419777 RepID=A0A494XEC1_9BURK|nr:iron-containing redox enzyme family protein [Trinickia fusca]RKP48232.1 iron-containing redox enzyme family protein [Trinickia fusca]